MKRARATRAQRPTSDAAMERREKLALSIASRELGITMERLKLSVARAPNGTVSETRYPLTWTFVDMAMDSHFAGPTIEPPAAGTLILIQNERIRGVDKKASQLPPIDARRIVLVDRAAPTWTIVSPISIIAQDRHHAIVKLISPRMENQASL